MDRYVSTYQRDYSWPYPKKQKLGSTTDNKDLMIFRIGPCTCGIDPKELRVPKAYGEKYDWSRLGPMGPLLDPKLYPAKTGPSPETDQMRFGQPDVYLKKVESRFLIVHNYYCYRQHHSRRYHTINMTKSNTCVIIVEIMISNERIFDFI